METLWLNEDDWPLLDFSDFPNEMISGMTLPQIQNHASQKIFNREYHSNDVHLAPNESTSSRFAEPISDADLHRKKINAIPAGTKNRNNWSTNMFNRWAAERKATELDDLTLNLPKNSAELLTANEKSIDYWLSKFIYETRKTDGNRFPGTSLGQITAGINSYLKENGRKINLFTDEAFEHFRGTLDLACKESARHGVGLFKKQAEVISPSEEERMWNIGCLGSDSPQQLLDTLVYLNGLHFALRSGAEHRNLTIHQIEVVPPDLNNEHYTVIYHENISKTNPRGWKHRKIEPKCVKHVDTLATSNSSRSHALLLIKYLSCRPANQEAFYLAPVKKFDPTNKIWYKPVPVGHNTLSETVSRLCAKGDVKGFKTNHSLRATCATRLYKEGLDEQLIMERTGHRSLSGVRSYKRTSDVHHFNSSVTIDNSTIQSCNSSAFGSATFNFIFNEGCNVTIHNSAQSSS